jgi:hypothetical protein
MAALFPGVCPSGQRERSVKPSAQPTEVRILPPPSKPQAPVLQRFRNARSRELLEVLAAGAAGDAL